MDWQPYIHSNPNILVGLYAAGWTETQILENYPTLTPEALRAFHAFAAQKITLAHVREGGRSFSPSPSL